MENHNTQFCAPHKKNNKFTCFSYKSLINMVNKWNKENPDDVISIKNDKKKMWKEIKSRLIKDSPCDYDHCLVETPFFKNLKDDEIKYETFLVKKPESWNKNPTAWLSTSDIRMVLLQYERLDPNFEFIGPVPIDFDEKIFGNCISEELCKINLHRLLKKKKSKIGIVFNLDKHNMSGSHWVSLFLDIVTGGVFFFDSVGSKPKPQIKKLMDRMVKQGNKLLEDKIINSDYFSRKYSISFENIIIKSPNTLILDRTLPTFFENMVLEYYCDDKQITFNNVIKKVKGNKLYLKDKISSNCDKINIFGFRQFYNNQTHQRKNSECGMYSINFISSLVLGDNFENLKNNIINDDEMNSFRDSKFYRPNIFNEKKN